MIYKNVCTFCNIFICRGWINAFRILGDNKGAAIFMLVISLAITILAGAILAMLIKVMVFDALP